MRLILEQPSGKHFGELDQVAERIAEEGEAATDCGQHERLGDDRHAARAQLLDGPVDTRHVQAEMVIARVLQAVAEVCVAGRLLAVARRGNDSRDSNER